MLAICLASLIGGLLGFKLPLQVLAGYPTIDFNSVLLFGTLALSIILILNRRDKLAVIASLVVLLAALGTIAQYIFNLSFGLDSIMPLLPQEPDYLPYPGRMPANSAFALLLGSTVTLLLASPKLHKFQSPILSLVALVIISIGAASIFGLMAEIEEAYSWAGTNEMGIIASLLTVLTGTSLTGLSWDRFFLSSPGIRQLWRSITLYSTLGVLTVSFLSALFAVLPFINQAKLLTQENLTHVASNRATGVQEFVRFAQSESRRISALVSERLPDDFDLLVAEVARREIVERDLEVALSLSESISGFLRVYLDRALTLQAGSDIPTEIVPASESSFQIIGPYLQDDRSFLIASRVDRDRFDNTFKDYFLLRASSIERLFRETDQAYTDTQLYLATEYRDRILIFEYSAQLRGFHQVSPTIKGELQSIVQTTNNDDPLTIDRQHSSKLPVLVAHSTVDNSPFSVIATVSSKEISSRLNKQLVDFLTAAIAIVLLASIGIFFLVRDLVLQAEQLQEQVDLESRRVKKSLQEKDTLLREIHHRVKNNLQVISSLLQLQSRRIEGPALKRSFQESHDRIRSIALLHEMLYRSENVATVNLHYYIEGLCQRLEASYATKGRVVFELAIEDFELDLDRAMPCGLLVNEILTNSIKHAFPEESNGTIRIEGKLSDNEQVILLIEDDGIGVDEATLNLEDGDSLGFQLISGLIGQLGGKLDRSSSKGTAYTISFPVHKEGQNETNNS